MPTQANTPLNTKCRANQLTALYTNAPRQTPYCINPQAHKPTSPQTHKPINSQTYKFTNSSTYKLTNSSTHQLKNLRHILQNAICFPPILANKIRSKHAFSCYFQPFTLFFLSVFKKIDCILHHFAFLV